MFAKFMSWVNDRSDARHFKISLVKSALRVAAGLAFMFSAVALGGFLLIVAEGLGVAEEL